MTDPLPNRTPPATDPPPANWLRGAGLVALLGIVAADIADGQLDADPWTYAIVILAVIYGPSVLRRRS